MSNILQIGFITEGSTDKRFLSNIIRKTFEHVVFDCNFDVEVYEPEYLPKLSGSFIEHIESQVTKHSYFHVICIHCDADSPTIDHVMQYKIKPARKKIETLDKACKNLVAIIPVQMTEAWLMADFDLLKDKINSNKSNSELGLPSRFNQIEKIANPKEAIIQAIRLSQENLSRRRKRITIADLYSPISQELSIDSLNKLPSYESFAREVKIALSRLNYLNEE